MQQWTWQRKLPPTVCNRQRRWNKNIRIHLSNVLALCYKRIIQAWTCNSDLFMMFPMEFESLSEYAELNMKAAKSALFFQKNLMSANCIIIYCLLQSCKSLEQKIKLDRISIFVETFRSKKNNTDSLCKSRKKCMSAWTRCSGQLLSN